MRGEMRLSSFVFCVLAFAAFVLLAQSLLAGCGGSDDTCRPGLIQVGPGVCQVPRGDAGSGGTMTRTGNQTGEPGGILPPAVGRQSGSAGGRGGSNSGSVGGRVGMAVAAAGGSGAGGGSGRSVGGSSGAGSGGMAQAQAGASGRLSGGSGGQGGEAGDEPEAGKGGAVAMAGKTSPPPPPPPPMHFCGDGTVDDGEVCDGDCPTSCDDKDPCTKDTKTGQPNQCNVECENTPITKAVSGDKCCPSGANAGNDPDCPDSCGDGVVSGDELCDGDCPTTCPNNPNPCTRDNITGSGCQRHCVSTNVPAGTICGNGKCNASGVCEFPKPGTGVWYGNCSETAECPTGAVCLAGICTTNCSSNGLQPCHEVSAGFNKYCMLDGICYQGGCSGNATSSNCPAGQQCKQSPTMLRYCAP